MAKILSSSNSSLKSSDESSQRLKNIHSFIAKALVEKFSKLYCEGLGRLNYELELATGGFSQANFLAEGGFGSVHRGVLLDSHAIAIKQHKLASSQGDHEFCSEVEVLNCAQHQNVVMLIGFCVEDRRRLLVYEYICNGSLDSHLYGKTFEVHFRNCVL
ncbi:hypothetical protein IFM89_015324 [Coptis chinensis]|uniref:Protein kinase domain-containing protein n=1 Tax=Coptis chinensis TaxID=261450 RepID=A0A835IRE3_9MAGN|nr:hypothetical protein IFM89_015324 [Coptis chinensis]